MCRDQVTSLVKDDELILHFGSILFRKLGPFRSADVAQRLRQLGRLMIEINKNHQPPLQLCEIIDVLHFDKLLKATETLCYVETDEHGCNSFQNPSIGLKLGYALLKCADIKKGLALRQNDASLALECNRFMALHKSEWNDTISGRA
jgi:hypothetical protein